MTFLPQQLVPVPIVLPFPTLPRRRARADVPFDPAERITLRAWYERCVLPEIEHEQARRSLQSDRCALNRWEECTGNPDIREVGRDDLVALRDRLEAKPCRPAAINAYWRELKAIFEDAVDRGLIAECPRLGRRQKSRLCKEPPKVQREPIGLAELEALYRGCRKATYPRGTQFPAPKLWRAALLLFWLYGPRPSDVFGLPKSAARWTERLIKFQSLKTSKLQGLPMTDLMRDWLQALSGHSDRFFPGFNSKGCHLRRRDMWKQGIYTTWRTEILPAAGLWTPVTFKNFRETCCTLYNGIEPGLGSWIAAHYVQGVTAQHYDLPTQRIREAVASRVVPQCFEDIG